MKKIPSKFFRDLFEIAKGIYRKYLKREKPDIWIFDSTIVSLSEKLLKNCGYQISGSKTRKQLKYTVGIKNGMPEKINLYLEKTYNSENIALGETILTTRIKKKSIVLFDRGLGSRKVFEKLTEKGLFFISRLPRRYKIKILSEDTSFLQRKDTTLIKEREGNLYHPKKKAKYIYRCIHVKSPNRTSKKNVVDKRVKIRALEKLKNAKNACKTKQQLIKEMLDEDIIIVTNIPKNQMPAEKVAKLYKQRWYIETFFKFIKQELNFSHIINRTENGIKSMLYLTMICALMLLTYKKENDLTGYKFVKRRFMLETEADLIITKFERKVNLLKAALLLVLQFWER